MSRTERLWRLRAELRARMPYTCPRCSSGAICPSFSGRYRYPDDTPEDVPRQPDRRGTWLCTDCGREFCEAD